MARRRPHPLELTERSQDARERALEALANVRTEGWSPTRAAKAAGTTLKTMKRYLGPVLEKQESGRYKAKGYDRMIRMMRFQTEKGLIALEVKDSRSASRIAKYWAAVDHYLTDGDPERLKPFRGKSVQVNGEPHPFITDLDTLERLALAGEVRFEDLYTNTI